MKNNTTPQSKPQNIQSKHPNPENKDNLDSRKNEEQIFKGDDTTHNKKPTKEDGKKHKKD